MKKIEEAIKVIQDYCKRYDYCYDCIFYDLEEDVCRFCVKGPFGWNLNSEALK